ncbi:MAG: DUF6600 domain-containing protein [Betaproteobacteria bacterium]
MDRFGTVLHRENVEAAVFTRARRALFWLAALLLAAAPFAARAADEDLPGRVGRVAEFAGQLFMSPEGQTIDWAPIGLNYPVTTGDNLWVSNDGRAEIDYGGGQFRLAGDTNLHISRLDDQQFALFVAQGRVIVRVRVLEPGDAARIDAPNTQIRLTRAGLYRIDVSPDRQTTTVVIREGEALVGLVNGAQQALPGQTVTVFGPDPVNADVRNGIGMDGFDSWSANRDRRYEKGRANQYVSRQMVGAVELDEYGYWQNDPTYGAVWYPTAVAADWAPYRDGYWTSSGAWGSTWVDYAPWGYAPFHYGRWAHIGGRWGWCPGGYVARPYWAPALVAWYGGPGWSLSTSYGAPVYGWVPLGWGDRYVPWWGRRECGERCWAHYNKPYAVNYDRQNEASPRHANIGVPGAVTAVVGETLLRAKPVPSNMVRVPPQAATGAPILAAGPVAGPLHIPGVKPGIGTAPQPASTFYPTSRGAREGGGTVAKPMLPMESDRGTARRGAGARGSSPSMPVPQRASPLTAPAAQGASGSMPASGSAAPSNRERDRSNARVVVPAAPAPEAGARIVDAPPARVEARPQTQRPPTAATMPAPSQQQQVQGGTPSLPLARAMPAPSQQQQPQMRAAPAPQPARSAPPATVSVPAVAPHAAQSAPAPAPQGGGGSGQAQGKGDHGDHGKPANSDKQSGGDNRGDSRQR